MASLRLRIEGQTFRDPQNREVTLRGINCAADAKFPATPDLPSDVSEHFFDGDSVSFVGRPFAAADAHVHFARLRRYGYNTLRYIFTWEAVEHERPGTYDEEWIQHTIDILRVARGYGFYVFVDPHQDVWSRFTGGSGAPMWTLYAVGLDPTKFQATEAALVHCAWPEGPERFPKMIWATSYWRLACQVVFTLFFAGRDFAPKAVLDGKNIQDWLQDHFVAACGHLARRIHEAGDLEDRVVIGWESMNEPNKGLIGQPDLSVIPPEQKLRKGTAPTAWQAMLLGSGRPCEVEVWDIGGLGPYKSGSQLVDPRGEVAWLSKDYDDTKYGWKRGSEWRLGECIWAQHGIWDPTTDELKRKDYFAKDPNSGKSIDYELFSNTYFMEFFRKFKSAIRSVHSDAIIFCQPPVLEIPPSLKGTKDDDPNMVYAPHFYDGITLMTKKWNRWWNVDVFGVLRGRYLSPAFAIKIGETAIRNCIRDQLSAIRQEGVDYMGERPCMFTEIGIPFDMDDKYAYRTGDYSSQLHAMDANHFALEGSGVAGYTLWVYVATNNHEWGDRWNGEDLSIYSLDDPPLPASLAAAANASTTSFDPADPSFSHSHSSESRDTLVQPGNLKSALSTPSISRAPSNASAQAAGTAPAGSAAAEASGLRAAEATVRPAPAATAGRIRRHGFDLQAATWTLELEAARPPGDAAPTEAFLPAFHFPRDRVVVEATSGRWTIEAEDVGPGATHGSGGGGAVQVLRWWHGAGEQKITVRGVQRKLGVAIGTQEEERGYLDQCQKQATGCTLM